MDAKENGMQHREPLITSIVEEENGEMDSGSDEELSSGALAAVSMVAAGVQFGWALQLSLLTPYVQELGIPHQWASFIWLCGPISGLLVQPVVGVWSDNCYSRWGPRRPFIVVGTVLITLAMLVIGYSADIGYLLGDKDVYRKGGVRPYACLVFVAGFWMLDLANNTLQGPCRALLADLAGDDQRTSGNAFFSMWMALGNVLGYATGASGAAHKCFPSWIVASPACGGACVNLKSAFLLAIVFLFITMLVTVFSAKERQLDPDENHEEEHEESLPKGMPRLRLVNENNQQTLLTPGESDQVTIPYRRWSMGPIRGSAPAAESPLSRDDSLPRPKRRNSGYLERVGSGVPEFFTSYTPTKSRKKGGAKMRRSRSAHALLQTQSSVEAETSKLAAMAQAAGEAVHKVAEKAASAAKATGQKISRTCASCFAPFVNIANEVTEGLRTLPLTNKMVMLVMGLTWMAWFPFLLFDTDWMGREVFHGEPGSQHAASAALYQLGVRKGAFGLLLNSVVQGITSLQVDSLCKRFGSKWVWGFSNVMIAICLGSTWVVERAADKKLPGGILLSSSTVQTAAVTIFAVLGAPLAVTYSVPYSMTSILTANDGGGQGLAMGVLNLAVVVPQVIVSVGAGPFDALFGGGNEPAFVAAAVFALAAGVCAAIFLPRKVFLAPKDEEEGVNEALLEGTPI